MIQSSILKMIGAYQFNQKYCQYGIVVAVTPLWGKWVVPVFVNTRRRGALPHIVFLPTAKVKNGGYFI